MAVMTMNTRKLTVVIVALLALATAPWLGWWVVGVGIMLLTLGIVNDNSWAGSRYVATVAGVGGGIIGAASAASTLWRIGNQPDYATRAIFGWLALVLALAALWGGLLNTRQPMRARVLLIGGSLLGFIAINLFAINTFYILALPLCWLGAILASTGDYTTRQDRGEERRKTGYDVQ
jgi:hypothetical protein